MDLHMVLLEAFHTAVGMGKRQQMLQGNISTLRYRSPLTPRSASDYLYLINQPQFCPNLTAVEEGSIDSIAEDHAADSTMTDIVYWTTMQTIPKLLPTKHYPP